MTLGVPPNPFGAYQSNLGAPTVPAGTVVTASGTAHTKGSYVQLIASLNFDVYLVKMMLTDVSASTTNTAFLVDIAIGAAGQEEVIIPNINAGYACPAVGGAGLMYEFPLYIPAGSRVAARAQAAIVSDTANLMLWCYGEPRYPIWAGRQVVDYGADLATSRGVTIVAGTAGAEGAWTQIVAATTQDHNYIHAGVGGAADTSVLNAMAYMDIGVGAAAAETPIVEDLAWLSTTTEDMRGFFPLAMPVNVKSGERLSVRISESGAAQSYDTILYGVS
jgi:hypothetical protein